MATKGMKIGMRITRDDGTFLSHSRHLLMSRVKVEEASGSDVNFLDRELVTFSDGTLIPMNEPSLLFISWRIYSSLGL